LSSIRLGNQAAALEVVTRNRTRGQHSGSTIKPLGSEAWNWRLRSGAILAVHGVGRGRRNRLRYELSRKDTPYGKCRGAGCCAHSSTPWHPCKRAMLF